MEGFERLTVNTGEATIFAVRGGSGPPLLLLHGFPETHLMWRDVAPVLAERHTVVCADLRGYGQSGCPPSTDDHAPYSKRALAQDMLVLMQRLGFAQFAVAGHDRGGRVAYRMALDEPGRITRLAVLDIIPTEEAWARANDAFAQVFWPWTLLAQPAPLPERLLVASPDAVIDDAALQWGSSPDAFSDEVRAAYASVLGDTMHAHAICEEYRAAATVDRVHDRADLAGGRRIRCPVLVLWARGALDRWYAEEGGPLAIWRRWADDVAGQRVDGGHFFPEEQPAKTAAMLRAFFG